MERSEGLQQRDCVLDPDGRVDYVVGQKCPWVVITGDNGCMGNHACMGFDRCAQRAREEFLALMDGRTTLPKVTTIYLEPEDPTADGGMLRMRVPDAE